MKRYIGYTMTLIGAVALYDAILGTPRAEMGTIGLLVLVVLIPGLILSRKAPPKSDGR